MADNGHPARKNRAHPVAVEANTETHGTSLRSPPGSTCGLLRASEERFGRTPGGTARFKKIDHAGAKDVVAVSSACSTAERSMAVFSASTNGCNCTPHTPTHCARVERAMA